MTSVVDKDGQLEMASEVASDRLHRVMFQKFQMQSIRTDFSHHFMLLMQTKMMSIYFEFIA